MSFGYYCSIRGSVLNVSHIPLLAIANSFLSFFYCNRQCVICANECEHFPDVFMIEISDKCIDRSLVTCKVPSPPNCLFFMDYLRICLLRPVCLAYQPPATSTFLSEQTSHQQPASSTFLSEQTSTSHQPPAKRTGP
jgi:hypothetical protein